MKLLTDLFSHPFLYGFLGFLSLVFFAWLFGIIFLPIHWAITKFTDTQCPECKGFFKRTLLKREVLSEREVLRTVNRVDQGVIYSDRVLEPDQVIEINRAEQVTFVEQTIISHWQCKNPLCVHKWETEEFTEYEGSLDV